MNNTYKRMKRIFSFVLMLCFFYVSVNATQLSNGLHTVEEWFVNTWEIDINLLQFETVGDVDYIYKIENNQAYIVNVHFKQRGQENRFLYLPDRIGNYDVVALGVPNKRMPIFWYIDIYGETPEQISLYYPNENLYVDSFEDYDPEMTYNVTEIVIPNGYKYIYTDSLAGYSGRIVFPKSMRVVYDFFEEQREYIIGTETFLGRNTMVFPECEFDKEFNEQIINCDNYIIASRIPAFIFDNYPNSICVPYNVSDSQIKNILNSNSYDNYRSVAFYCADDSPTYALIQELGGYTVNTDIPKAEYIEFPDETVNIHVGDVVDLEAKTYPTDAIWTACDYEVSDPSIVKIDDYSGRITALKEGTVTVTATHCERGFVDTCTVNVVPEAVPGVNEVKPATDTPYFAYGNRDYSIDVTGSPSKIQVVRDNGGTTTIDRRKAQITSNGETETWVVNMRVEAGTHSIRAKYGKVWDERITRFTVKYDTPKAHSLDFEYENGIGTFEVVTDPSIIKVRFLVSNGCTLTYSQNYSYIAEDGMRHWVVTRKLPQNTTYTLATKLGYTWTTTDFIVNT